MERLSKRQKQRKEKKRVKGKSFWRTKTGKYGTKIAELVSYGWTSALQWVPSHLEIPGNEMADQKVQQAAESTRSKVPLTLRKAKDIISTHTDKYTAMTPKNEYTSTGLAANEACPLCGHARMDGDHLPQCTGLAEDIVSRYCEARLQMVKKQSTGIG
ncbi:reverse transcriptase [Trichonephila clavipes]|nr:reverse transcriptase [Trichonephila clavipes]